ncbi:MAG: GNAT family N-acetyltransferase [Coriobacteriia bacterium]|nr:GNAT family N-acetyltransferase [Coriobacteriia bacterium]
MSVEIIEVVGAPSSVRELLYDVLYKDFGVDKAADNWFHQERGGEFLLKIDSAYEIMGIARLMPVTDNDPSSRQVRQVAVAKNAQGRGVGRELMTIVEELALDQGASRLWLESRSVAYGFYGSLGYEDDGEEFMSELTHIPHRHMHKNLLSA